MSNSKRLAADFFCDARIPPFSEPPKVIIIGARVFSLHEAKNQVVHRECFSYRIE